MSKYLVIIHDIKEFPYDVEAADEQAARAEAEALWKFDGGPQGDHYEMSVRCLDPKPVPAPVPIVPPTGWTIRQIAQAFVNDIEAAHGAGAPDLADEWPDLHATYDVAVKTLAETAVRESRLAAALTALLDWGREHTSPRDANSPHDLLVAAKDALDEAVAWSGDPSAERAWRYATRAMTQEDADLIRYDCQQEGGFYPLAALTRDAALKECQERWGDFPMLQSLVEIACQRVADKWAGSSDAVNAAMEWMMCVVEFLAKEEGLDLVPEHEREPEA